ncbi:hypothetical protein HPB50_013451 [Hyalomma asiaticum]|uniref:Uncharacterized protein n=1 Tax=Hyalomma asiaticum TaxID=266040 RepID=A0ACB7SQB9_HYAAI|nr:hypothetical protein HPB50_013451 [Hyalomma asiaticum]
MYRCVQEVWKEHTLWAALSQSGWVAWVAFNTLLHSAWVSCLLLCQLYQTTQNSGTNTLYQLREEMEVKLQALDARLWREIETTCAAARQEFHDMLNQAVSLNSTVATLHALISSSISTSSTDMQQQTERKQMHQEFTPSLTSARNAKRSHPYTRPASLRNEDGDS